MSALESVIEFPRAVARVGKRPKIGSCYGYSLDALSIPATEFTGDFYMTADADDSLWFAFGDIAGHGLRAAIFMAMMQEEFERIVESCDSAEPAEVVAVLDRTLREELPSNRFATLVVGRLFRDGSVQIVNAGHNWPLLARADGSVEWICSDGPVVGLLPSAQWLQQTVRLESGDRLLLYTDGIVEASRGAEEFGRHRLQGLRNAPIAHIYAAVRDFHGASLEDDATLLAITRK